MNTEKIKYIIRYYSRLFTENEKIARTHLTSMQQMMYKLEKIEGYNDSESYKEELQWLKDKNLVTNDVKVLSLLEKGSDSFYLETATRINKESIERVYYNQCRKCNQLARTPYARQCRKCGFNWHYVVMAEFTIDYVCNSESNENKLNLFGQIENGEVENGMQVDLTFLDIASHPKVENISFLQNENSAQELVVLTITILDFEDRGYILKKRNVKVQIIGEKKNSC